MFLSAAACAPYAGNVDAVEIDAPNIRQLILRLDERFPGLGAVIDRRMAIAVDGVIYQNAWGQPLSPDSEVHLIPRIAGG